MPRVVEVSADRLTRWVAGFEERHGAARWATDGDAYLLTALDGSTARLTAWAAPGELPPPDPAGWASPPTPLAVVLVRRGGYGLARVERGESVQHKVGSRYVQSRTAAGGWSQQRYARRRANQADALVEAVVGHARTVLGHGPFGGLVLGGDRALAGEVADALRHERVLAQGVPVRELYDLPDPNATVLKAAVARALSVRIEVVNA